MDTPEEALREMTLVLGELFFNYRRQEDVLEKALVTVEELKLEIEELKGGEDAGN